MNMKNAKPAIAVMLIASLLAPAAYAKAKKAPVVPPPSAASQASSGSQAGGLPAANARIDALEGAVTALRADLTAEIAARQAADTRLANALNNEIAARQAADEALARQIAANPPVFVAEGFRNNLTGGPVMVAAKTVPAGSYLVTAAVQMINSQRTADAKARCVMEADGVLLADTSDLLFPILTTAAGPPSGAFGSTIFAPLQGSVSSTNPINVVVSCSEGNGGSAGLDVFVSLAALKVATVQ
jgi:hypothetical protein